jgi:hypothetical protein
MRGLSLTQPWATLIAIGAKRIETRSWSTSYRGPIAIHASKSFPRDCRDMCALQPFLRALTRAGLSLPELPTGAIVAVARVVGCTLTERVVFDLSQPAQAAEREFGDYTRGRWAWFIQGVKPLAKPIPCKGALGLWTVPRAIVETLGGRADPNVRATDGAQRRSGLERV